MRSVSEKAARMGRADIPVCRLRGLSSPRLKVWRLESRHHRQTGMSAQLSVTEFVACSSKTGEDLPRSIPPSLYLARNHCNIILVEPPLQVLRPGSEGLRASAADHRRVQ